jgi:hypothetical protein
MTTMSESTVAPVGRQSVLSIADLDAENEYIFKHSDANDPFADWITEARFYAVRGFWMNGARPFRPALTNLPIWKIKWLQNQKKVATYHSWLGHREQKEAHAKRRRDEGNEILMRRVAAQVLRQQKQLAAGKQATPELEPMPIALTTLAEIWLARKKAKVAA